MSNIGARRSSLQIFSSGLNPKSCSRLAVAIAFKSSGKPLAMSAQHRPQTNLWAVLPRHPCHMMNRACSAPRHNMHASCFLGPQTSSPFSQITISFPPGRAPGICARRSWPLKRHLVVEIAGERRVYHRRIRLRRLADPLERGHLDPADPLITMVEATDAQFYDGVDIG